MSFCWFSVDENIRVTFTIYHSGSHRDIIRDCEPRIKDIPRIARLSGFRDKNFSFRFRHRPMLPTPRDHTEFARSQGYFAVVELDAHLAAPDKEEFVFVFMVVPGKDPDEFYKFYLLAVQLGDDFWPLVPWIRANFSGREDFSI